MSESRSSALLQTSSHVLVVGAGLVYLFGFIIMSIFDASYGIADFSLFRTKVIAVGTLFVFLVALPMMVTFRMFSVFGLTADPGRDSCRTGHAEEQTLPDDRRSSVDSFRLRRTSYTAVVLVRHIPSVCDGGGFRIVPSHNCCHCRAWCLCKDLVQCSSVFVCVPLCSQHCWPIREHL
jgi:hypothetical protein